MSEIHFTSAPNAVTIIAMNLAPEAFDSPITNRDVKPALRGAIELICGCMFSGKTTKLLDLLRAEPAQAVLIVKHDKDRRYSRTKVMTHDGDGCDAVTVAHTSDIVERVADATEVVAIDEGHFYDVSLADVCRQLAGKGKRVIVTALDLDMWGQPFETVEAIKACARIVPPQQTQCVKCGQPATHTHRKTPIVGQNLVGGEADFEPRCKACWSPPPEPHIDSAEMA